MYKIRMLRETGYMRIYFIFHETDRKSINPDVLFYAGQAVLAPGESGWRSATAVLIGAAIYYRWRVWQLLSKMAEGYEAGDATVKRITLRDTNYSDIRFVFVKRHFTAALHVLLVFCHILSNSSFLSAFIMKLSAACFIGCVCVPGAVVVRLLVEALTLFQMF